MDTNNSNTEIVVFNEFAEIVVENKKLSVCVGTQIFTIRYLNDGDEANTTNTGTIISPHENALQNSNDNVQNNKESEFNYDCSWNQQLQNSLEALSYDNRYNQELNDPLEAPHLSSEEDQLELIDVTNSVSDIIHHTNEENSPNFINSINNNEEIPVNDDDTSLHSIATTSINESIQYRSISSSRANSPGTISPTDFSNNIQIFLRRCSICFKYFTNSSSYKSHKCLTNNTRQNLRTSKVSRSLKSKNNNEEGRLCRFCGKLFVRPYSLRRHEIIHTGEKPYRCNVCQKAYTQPVNIVKHKCSGQISQVDPICEYCGTSFKNKDYLEIHRQTHISDIDANPCDAAEFVNLMFT